MSAGGCLSQCRPICSVRASVLPFYVRYRKVANPNAARAASASRVPGALPHQQEAMQATGNARPPRMPAARWRGRTAANPRPLYARSNPATPRSSDDPARHPRLDRLGRPKKQTPPKRGLCQGCGGQRNLRRANPSPARPGPSSASVAGSAAWLRFYRRTPPARPENWQRLFKPSYRAVKPLMRFSISKNVTVPATPLLQTTHVALNIAVAIARHPLIAPDRGGRLDRLIAV